MLTRNEAFQVIPAIDVLGDEAVRLERGDFSRVTHREVDPLALAERVTAAGAKLVHLVDLTAARSGVVRPELVRRVVAACGSTLVQAAGGIRALDDVVRLLGAGACRVVIGTAAFAGEDALESYVSELDERLVVAIDVRDGLVAVDGWERTSQLATEDAVLRCREAGVRRILCTAIERDGTLAGPNVELLKSVCELSGLPVLAAGGVRTIDDLVAVEAAGCEGAIVGRALFDGTLPLSIFADGQLAGTS
ncbi:MAG TPA: 1-(5-phosphoribosyl)-5-[(5-phosphoribosylamino)methylideneamino] imidazole-4-carboxamide isomerase [Gaiellaceae bacterium]|nr:1-(5-phosphoribosyl)-5-[(5-phosphoribosylamino)methylideneamino] imidazole-4-carboxamide isomerase [Gaiellaceae bacterium]